MRIVIPTYKRAGLMKTHLHIPAEFHKDIILVVREFEHQLYLQHYPTFDYFVIPDDTDGLPATRQLIMNKFKDETYWVFDDDLVFFHVSPNPGSGTKFIKRFMTSEDWKQAFVEVEKAILNGYSFGGFRLHGSIPLLAEFSYNKRITTNQWWHGPSIPSGIDCTRVRYAEDLDIIFQLIAKGCQNMVFNYCSASNASRGALIGGCKDQRTNISHNDSSKLLQQLWPNFVTIDSYINEINPLYEKGKEVLRVTCYYDKARKHYLQSLPTTLFGE